MASHPLTFTARRIHSLFWFLLAAVLTTVSINQVEAAPSAVSRARTRTLYELPKISTTTIPLSIGCKNIRIAKGRRLVWSKNIDIKALEPNRKNIIWTRLEFSAQDTVLRLPAEPTTGGGWGANLPGDILKITNQVDKSAQYFNAATLKQWSFKSAFFNGGNLTLELHADQSLPAGQNPSVVVTSVKVNTASSEKTDVILLPPPNSLCNANDGRRPSADAKVGRMFPVSCTGWTFNDPSNSGCQLTAGHCFEGKDASEQVLQFNVPKTIVIRTQAGDKVPIVRHPPADQQFAIDVASVQFNSTFADEAVDDEDWGYFGVHPNPNTGLRPREQFGNQAFNLAPVNLETGLLNEGTVNVGDQVTVRGYGVVKADAKLDLSQVQQSHTASVQELPDVYHVYHRADTEGGNSGSPIILPNGQSMGIHTNGGCLTVSRESGNVGSTVAMRGLRAALAAPVGVCKV